MLLNNKIIYLISISGFCALFSIGSSEFHLINMEKSYEDSRSYCRQTYTDLATIHNFSKMKDLVHLVQDKASKAWIGLEIADKRMWHWSLPAHPLVFTNWREGTPEENDQDACAAMDDNGKWFESDCQTKRSFVCHSDIGSHIFVAESKSWRNAQTHCRGLSTDLVSILSAEVNAVVSNMSRNAWIGLFKDPWKWSDGSNSSFRYWTNKQPNYLEGQDCVAAVFKSSGKWNDLRCSGKRKFICQGAYKGTTTIKTTTKGSTKLTYLSTYYNVTSKGITVTFHFTLEKDSTNVSTMTALTTEGTSTSTPQPVTLAPQLVTLAPQPVTLAPQPVTLAPQPVTLAPQPVTLAPQPVTLAPQPVTLAPQPVTLAPQPVTLVPHPNTPGNLVLVQQNLTWVEAIDYCRRNYIDLIHISTEDIQMKVAEKVKNATTPYVWIGLRYTCGSKIWFWTRSMGGCYQNWAPQQGYEGNYGCGVTGAIQATGRQQWVGLPQTQNLNFICYACTG